MSQERESKPPIDISKSKSTEKEFKKGSLEYTDPPKEGGKKVGLGQGWIPAILALILAVGFVFVYAPKQNDIVILAGNVEEVLSRVTAVDTKLQGEKGRVDNIVNAMGEYAKKSELSGLAQKSTVDGLANLPTLIEEKFTTLETTYEERIAALEAKIIILEEEKKSEEEEETSKDLLELDLGYSKSFEFSSGIDTYESQLFFEIENNLSSDVEKVELTLIIHSRGESVPLISSRTSVTGGWPLQWEKIHIGPGLVVLKGVTPAWSEGLSIEAKDSEDVFLTLVLGLEEGTFLENPVRFYIEGKVDGYKLSE